MLNFAPGAGILSRLCISASGRGCNPARHRNKPRAQIQRAEWQLLFDYSARPSEAAPSVLDGAYWRSPRAACGMQLRCAISRPSWRLRAWCASPSRVPCRPTARSSRSNGQRRGRSGMARCRTSLVQRGAQVAQGAALIELDSSEARAAVGGGAGAREPGAGGFGSDREGRPGD